MNRLEKQEKYEELQIIQDYFNTHKKIHNDKHRIKLLKIKKKILCQLCQEIEEKYKEQDEQTIVR